MHVLLERQLHNLLQYQLYYWNICVKSSLLDFFYKRFGYYSNIFCSICMALAVTRLNSLYIPICALRYLHRTRFRVPSMHFCSNWGCKIKSPSPFSLSHRPTCLPAERFLLRPPSTISIFLFGGESSRRGWWVARSWRSWVLWAVWAKS
jgi:hypothetical protein